MQLPFCIVLYVDNQLVIPESFPGAFDKDAEKPADIKDFEKYQTNRIRSQSN